MSSTGKLIQELRIKSGFTQKTLADALHITDKAISKWERDICLPDVTLLPKLALLLDIDVEALISKSIEQEDWIGLIDIKDCDFSQIVYDKPLVYYLLSHFLLLGICHIHFITTEKNRKYLEKEEFSRLGFSFSFDQPSDHRAMIIDHPWFIFGSDLTQQFQGAMISERNTKLIPENQQYVALFAQDVDDYFRDKLKYCRTSIVRTLGRGMICLDMDDYNKVLDVAAFIRTYQNNTGLLIGSLEEIAYRNGILSATDLMTKSDNLPYGQLLKHLATKLQGSLI